ncbi:cyclophane-forming radical SAM/SPASM peptide maturase GrrM/OscB [Aetokthonos hydrillicola]
MLHPANQDSLIVSEELREQEFGPVKLVVIQPSTFCNLDCDYCYLPNRHLKHKLSLDLLEPIFRNLFSSRSLKSHFTIVWHAGEPLAMPIQFYREAFEIINNLSDKYNSNQYQFAHAIQTNGILLNQPWCDLINRYNIQVGVSLDGPAFLHDAHRKTKKGLGTHASTMRGISYLKANGIEFSVITVLTQDSLDYPEEMFQFFIENDIDRIGFNIEETEGYNQVSSLEKNGTDIKYRQFMKKFYELVQQSKQKISVREFEFIENSIYYSLGTTLGQSDPFTIISIDHKGNFMTFSPELLSLTTSDYGEFVLGNVVQDTFDSVFQTEKFRRIYNDIKAGVELCKESCEYFQLCGGGAPANKYFENGSFRSTETMYCRYTQKILTDIVLEDIEKRLDIC